MTDDDLLPNGMRLGQRVQVRGASTGLLAIGEVVGWQAGPTVVIRQPDGRTVHVVGNKGLKWDPLDGEELPADLPGKPHADIFRHLLDGPPKGVWMAYYSDGSAARPFPTEVEALRYAVAYSCQVELTKWGQDVGRPEASS